jgi:Flp pilus assembly protein CpaB
VSVVGSLAVPIGALEDGEQDTTVETGGAAVFRTRYLVQNATVLAVGRRTQEEGEDPRHIFTLAMPPDDIERLVFTTQRGNLWFTLVPEPEDGEDFEVFDTPGRVVTDAQD